MALGPDDQRRILFINGPITQEFIDAAWAAFPLMLKQLIPPDTEWGVDTFKRWTLKTMRTLNGDPTRWRLRTPQLDLRFKEASLNISHEESLLYWVMVQRALGLNYIQVAHHHKDRYDVLNEFRLTLPLTEAHTWYLQYSSKVLLWAKDVEPDIPSFHSFGFGNDPSKCFTANATPDFEQRLRESLSWRTVTSQLPTRKRSIIETPLPAEKSLAESHR
jgi:hypothetical protein